MPSKYLIEKLAKDWQAYKSKLLSQIEEAERLVEKYDGYENMLSEFSNMERFAATSGRNRNLSYNVAKSKKIYVDQIKGQINRMVGVFEVLEKSPHTFSKFESQIKEMDSSHPLLADMVKTREETATSIKIKTCQLQGKLALLHFSLCENLKVSVISENIGYAELYIQAAYDIIQRENTIDFGKAMVDEVTLFRQLIIERAAECRIKDLKDHELIFSEYQKIIDSIKDDEPVKKFGYILRQVRAYLTDRKSDGSVKTKEEILYRYRVCSKAGKSLLNAVEIMPANKGENLAVSAKLSAENINLGHDFLKLAKAIHQLSSYEVVKSDIILRGAMLKEIKIFMDVGKEFATKNTMFSDEYSLLENGYKESLKEQRSIIERQVVVAREKMKEKEEREALEKAMVEYEEKFNEILLSFPVEHRSEEKVKVKKPSPNLKEKTAQIETDLAGEIPDEEILVPIYVDVQWKPRRFKNNLIVDLDTHLSLLKNAQQCGNVYEQIRVLINIAEYYRIEALKKSHYLRHYNELTQMIELLRLAENSIRNAVALIETEAKFQNVKSSPLSKLEESAQLILEHTEATIFKVAIKQEHILEKMTAARNRIRELMGDDWYKNIEDSEKSPAAKLREQLDKDIPQLLQLSILFSITKDKIDNIIAHQVDTFFLPLVAKMEAEPDSVTDEPCSEAAKPVAERDEGVSSNPEQKVLGWHSLFPAVKKDDQRSVASNINHDIAQNKRNVFGKTY